MASSATVYGWRSVVGMQAVVSSRWTGWRTVRRTLGGQVAGWSATTGRSCGVLTRRLADDAGGEASRLMTGGAVNTEQPPAVVRRGTNLDRVGGFNDTVV